MTQLSKDPSHGADPCCDPAAPARGVPAEPGWLDRLGVFSSSACAVHCVATAIAPGVLGAVGLSALMGHEAEWAFTGAAAAFALGAAGYGLRRHGSRQPAMLLGIGLIALVGSRFCEELELEHVGVLLSVIAALALVLGHLANLRASRQPKPAQTVE